MKRTVRLIYDDEGGTGWLDDPTDAIEALKQTSDVMALDVLSDWFDIINDLQHEAYQKVYGAKLTALRKAEAKLEQEAMVIAIDPFKDGRI